MAVFSSPLSMIAWMVVPALGSVLMPRFTFEWAALLGPVGGAGLSYLWWRPASEAPR